MNKRKSITKTVTAARSVDPLAPRGPLTCTIDLDVLRKFSMKELQALRVALHTTYNVAGALSCAPRCTAENNGCGYNAAGTVIENIVEWLISYEQAVVNVAQAARPNTGVEAEYRGHVLVGFEADLEDDLATVAVIAAEASRDENTGRHRDLTQRMRGAS